MTARTTRIMITSINAGDRIFATRAMITSLNEGDSIFVSRMMITVMYDPNTIPTASQSIVRAIFG